jgi:hypothetical protein
MKRKEVIEVKRELRGKKKRERKREERREKN